MFSAQQICPRRKSRPGGANQHFRADPGDRLQLAGKAGSQFGIRNGKGGSTLNFNRQLIKVVFALDDQLVFATEVVIPVGAGLGFERIVPKFLIAGRG